METGKQWEITELVYERPRDHEVVIELRAAGMCHSDDHVRTGDTPMRYPIVGGHEGSGVVTEVGPHVSRVAVGDRVAVSYIPACGVCRPCASGHQNLCEKGLNAGTGLMLDGTCRLHTGDVDLGGFCALGTFSEHMVISEYSCIPLPGDISFEVAALLGCGVPTGWGSAVYSAGVAAGDTVVVYGAGGVGSNAVQGAAMAGALRVVVVDPNPMKRQRAVEFGATHTFATHAEAQEFVVDATWGHLAEHAILTVGVLQSENVTDALSIVGKRGQVTVTAVGRSGVNQLATSGNEAIRYEKRIVGSLFGSCSATRDIPKLMGLYRSGALKLDELISARYRLDEVNEGYADLLDGKNLRGLLTFD